jgi:hypothetical protein
VKFVHLLLLACALAAPAQTVSPTYFGMHMHGGVISRQPWPSVSFGSQRLWDGSVSWSDINTARGAYDWSKLDHWLALSPQHGAELLYTFGRVPQWASSSPYDTTCGVGPGQCAPPNDVNADGTGTNQHFKDFVTALAQHNKASTAGHIKYWELWNEMGDPPVWSGTVAQMVRMAKDAATILKQVDPQAVVLVPSAIIEGARGRNFLDAYLAAGGKNYADAIAFHGYVQKSGKPLNPESILDYIAQTRAILAKYGLQAKPLWDTEASWGDPATSLPPFNDPDKRMGFLARMFLLQHSAGVKRFFWYMWNNNYELGTLWTADRNVPSNPGILLKPGIAYRSVQSWIVGATLTAPCSHIGTVWTCNFSQPGGYTARAVWDTARSCSNGLCTTSSYAIPRTFTQYHTLDGALVKVTGSAVPIGYKPILLENW